MFDLDNTEFAIVVNPDGTFEAGEWIPIPRTKVRELWALAGCTRPGVTLTNRLTLWAGMSKCCTSQPRNPLASALAALYQPTRTDYHGAVLLTGGGDHPHQGLTADQVDTIIGRLTELAAVDLPPAPDTPRNITFPSPGPTPTDHPRPRGQAPGAPHKREGNPMQFTYIGDWCTESPVFTSAFAVVAEGETPGHARIAAAAAVMNQYPETEVTDPRDFWTDDKGAYLITAFMGDVTSLLVAEHPVIRA
ncbi:hypothetical protein [Streptomyces sp. Ac-502]|uniref:hypothetical protein n=1 Tax=Streptomyces sp. Ac-502 TaxID=3342801 RepID=UPI003862D1B4